MEFSGIEFGGVGGYGPGGAGMELDELQTFLRTENADAGGQ
jgi:hypothetical protein